MDTIPKHAPTAQRSTLSLTRGVVKRPAPLRQPEWFCVWADGRRGPRIKYPTQAEAESEAARLAALPESKGRRFDVIACTVVARRIVT